MCNDLITFSPTCILRGFRHPGEVGSERMPMRLVTHGSALAMAGKAVEEMTNIVLTETSTETILNLPSLIAASDVREVALVTDRNKRYESA